MPDNIKTMQLYPRAERIFADLEARGYASGSPLSLDVLTQLDQLHYHGTEALDAAIAACGIRKNDRVLEVGSGWGGCARYLAHSTGADIQAVELQADYDLVARDLTHRASLGDKVTHVNADFLDLDLAHGDFDHAVSWLALFHIPRRADYLSKITKALKPGGALFVEDLYQIQEPTPDEANDFRQHLFPNSLVKIEPYRVSLNSAGLEIVEQQDMTADWTDFTAARLVAFREARANYEAVHGAEGYSVIETFYTKMAGYFERGLVGGLRFSARRRA
ncbi:MAG: SAM-dependent methyltransferase [Rhizobiaceae bacterium]